ncbi:glycosyl hydrolase family 28 protein [Pedobacter sp. BMA]|uniref:glycosyl hydrolase family 28 protein n=1 Tax=Pedobacter sp. BMA TaxID=1663685 RepID=UPI00069EB71E|nr:glycosyl hydrolase family 28 protein [Pedobacter sp. BMA]
MPKIQYLLAITFFLFTLFLSPAVVNAFDTSKFNLLIAPGTLSERSVTLIWEKQDEAKSLGYEIVVNNKRVSYCGKTNFTITELKPNTWYIAKVLIKGKARASYLSNSIRFKTMVSGKIFNILSYGAVADSTRINTKSIQAAIDACSAGGTVFIPRGTFLSGALHLKSNMTLKIEEGGVLKGTQVPEDYLPMILNRFEGWEMKTYASLLNAGTLNRDGSYNVRNLTITGKGKIVGGGRKLGEAMTKANGIRSRGRLICLMNAQNVSISGLTVTEPPCWTIHYIYSDDISCYNLNIITKNIRNGDGIDPDSSTDSYIFNSTFDTGDDCIAIKSGKNPEGFLIAKPTKNVRITDCDFKNGHGISIGSEMSGGVSDVLVQDCKAGKLLHGMQIKGTKDRGGYVRNVTVADCELMKITIFSAVNYNNDGEPATEIPTFENFVFRNIDMSIAVPNGVIIDINGFEDVSHRLNNVSFSNIILPENAKVNVTNAEDIQFNKVKSISGMLPTYKFVNVGTIIKD